MGMAMEDSDLMQRLDRAFSEGLACNRDKIEAKRLMVARAARDDQDGFLRPGRMATIAQGGQQELQLAAESAGHR